MRLNNPFKALRSAKNTAPQKTPEAGDAEALPLARGGKKEEKKKTSLFLFFGLKSNVSVLDQDVSSRADHLAANKLPCWRWFHAGMKHAGNISTLAEYLTLWFMYV